MDTQTDPRILTTKPGQVVYHKTIPGGFTVLNHNEDGTIKVRMRSGEERDFAPFELALPKPKGIRVGRKRLY